MVEQEHKEIQFILQGIFIALKLCCFHKNSNRPSNKKVPVPTMPMILYTDTCNSRLLLTSVHQDLNICWKNNSSQLTAHTCGQSL